MGWTTTHRAKGITNDEWFMREVIGADRTIMASSTIKNVYYAAVREDKTGEVWGLICLIQRAPNSYHNFGWKSQTEDMGPNASDAPAKVLDALTETDNEYSLAWRAECRKNLAHKAALPKLKEGTRITTARGLTFRHHSVMVTATEFEYAPQARRRNIFRTVGLDENFLVTLPNWRDYVAV